MLDPNSNIAAQLAQALAHHQKNLIDNDKAEQDIEALRRMLSAARALSADSEDGAEPPADK